MKRVLPPNCVFPEFHREKRRKIRVKGFVIARIPSWKKKKNSCERLRDSQSSIVKKEKVREKGFVIARIPSRKKKKVRVKGFVIARVPS
jgi:hypothetical protein